jgi:hypothetical protein
MCGKVGPRGTCRCSVLWIRADAAVADELVIVLVRRFVDEVGCCGAVDQS